MISSRDRETFLSLPFYFMSLSVGFEYVVSFSHDAYTPLSPKRSTTEQARTPCIHT